LLSIGVVIALPQEARMFARDLPEANEVALVDRHLLVCVAGVGPDCAQSAARLLLARGASALMSWGVAAALIPDLECGSLLLPQTVVGGDGTVFAVDTSWHHHMREASFDMRPIAEARTILSTGAQKRALGDATHAVAADMESASVARVAQEAGVPFLVVRAVADDIEMALPAWLMDCFDTHGRMRGWRFFARVLRHPHDILAVARLARAFAAAENSLRRFKTQHLRHPLILT
jgi:adenosylhomocysteine nucleosidase